LDDTPLSSEKKESPSWGGKLALKLGGRKRTRILGRDVEKVQIYAGQPREHIKLPQTKPDKKAQRKAGVDGGNGCRPAVGVSV